MRRVDVGDVHDAGRAVLGELNCAHPPTVSEHLVRLAEVRVVTAEVVAKLRSDARDNRGRIRAVARVVFAAEGVDVPIREIARRAEVGVATVYRHFQTREALLAEAFAEQLALCSTAVAEGLAADDPWRGFGRRPTSPPTAIARGGCCSNWRGGPRKPAPLRADFVLADVSLALMANEGVRAESTEMRVAASWRFAALMIQSFRANPVPAPLPPAVRLPLSRS